MPLEYQYSEAPVAYPEALSAMLARVDAIHAGKAQELLWFLEHPSLYTSGTSAKKSDLLGGLPFPVYDAGRGGQWTYHGPGQRICYLMLDLKSRDMMDLRRYVQLLEQWIITTLAHFGVAAFTREGRIGVWVKKSSGEAKVAALGIRVRRWVTFHGIALNVNPDLSHYAGIIPCGIREHGVTSLHDLDIRVNIDEVDAVLKKEFQNIF